jgi:hypothetical protein
MKDDTRQISIINVMHDYYDDKVFSSFITSDMWFSVSEVEYRTWRAFVSLKNTTPSCQKLVIIERFYLDTEDKRIFDINLKTITKEYEKELAAQKISDQKNRLHMEKLAEKERLRKENAAQTKARREKEKLQFLLMKYPAE